MSEKHDENGKFSSEGMKGNKHAKKDMTQEIAKDMVSKEMWWVAHHLTNVPQRIVKEKVKNGEFEDESLLANTIIKQVAKGNVKTLTWFAEMMIGRPKQQVEQKITEHSIQINIDNDDAQL